MGFNDVETTRATLEEAGYVCTTEIATVVFLAAAGDKPVLVEGPAGVGKTELAKAVAQGLGRDLIRLQCYEGLDEAKALYEWEYAKQLLYTQIVRDKISDVVAGARTLSEAVDGIAAEADAFFSERFLLPRPLLKAIIAPAPAVLLIDEIDKADPEFEAFLLELLSDFQVTIPELGTVKAPQPPIVIVTSNRTREIHDALKRRCLYHWVDYPSAERELAIVKSRVPNIGAKLSQQVVGFVQALREQDLFKVPGVAETIDWATALTELDAKSLSPQIVGDTLGALLKYQDDIGRMQGDALNKVIKEAVSD